MLTERERHQKEHMKALLSECETDEERKTIFLMFARNLDYSAEVIKEAIRETGITDAIITGEP